MSMAATCMKCRGPVNANGRKFCEGCRPATSREASLKAELEVLKRDADFLRKDNERLRNELVVTRSELRDLKWKGRAA